MASQTPNIGLVQPAGSDIVDADVVANNMLLIDRYIAFTLVTNKESVASPYHGLKVLESTGNIYIYITGQGWVQMGSPNVGGGGGRKAYNTFTVNGTLVTTTETMSIIKTTFTAEAGRRYWVDVSAAFEFVAGSSFEEGASLNLRWAVGASVTTSDTAMTSRPFVIEAQGYSTLPQINDFRCVGEFVPGVNGSVTVGLTYKANYGCSVRSIANSTSPNVIIVRDVGT